MALQNLPVAQASAGTRKKGHKQNEDKPHDIRANHVPTSLDWYGRNTKNFQSVFNFEMKRYGDTCQSLTRALAKLGYQFAESGALNWKRGRHAPRSKKAFKVLEAIERRYGLPVGYFKESLRIEELTAARRALKDKSAEQKHLIRRHIPRDFEHRDAHEQQEILLWIEKNVLGGSTEYGRYIRRATFLPYRINFPKLSGNPTRKRQKVLNWINEEKDQRKLDQDVLNSNIVTAPARLSAEMSSLIKFKTTKLLPPGWRRTFRWAPGTAELKISKYGLMFGALVASKNATAAGLGIPRGELTFASLVFPAVWEWYLDWCLQRRGFHNRAESHCLHDLSGMTRHSTGWLRQHPEFSMKLRSIPGVISNKDVAAARRNWDAACDGAYNYAVYRAMEIKRLAHKHRNPFEAILPVLDSDSPLAEYRKIADEVFRLIPDEVRFPRPAAGRVRDYLMLRFGMHSGLRQRNFRELLFCLRDQKPREARQLESQECGELRWSTARAGWEVFIPASAFKNYSSTFFSGEPFSLLLPDLENLYAMIEKYLMHHRPVLLGDSPDPGNFFIMTGKNGHPSSAYSKAGFYRNWREIIQRYGIFNPYTGRGAIKGLLPHGPHSVRDVLATHILKKTGSYELAGYAIQDTADTVRKHYDRLLPRHKSAKAAVILDQVWTTSGTRKNSFSE
ncbi:MAG TPA: hypothetical protein VNW15_01460 [Rhizomicrobium sp.]|jgi:hypothetical protein|nr:hypothetical protein [Rhizomicrobium sp.]